jgi:hypothetical protein
VGDAEIDDFARRVEAAHTGDADRLTTEPESR